MVHGKVGVWLYVLRQTTPRQHQKGEIAGVRGLNDLRCSRVRSVGQSAKLDVGRSFNQRTKLGTTRP